MIQQKNQAALDSQIEREKITKEVHAMLQVQANDFVAQTIEQERRKLQEQYEADINFRISQMSLSVPETPTRVPLVEMTDENMNSSNIPEPT